MRQIIKTSILSVICGFYTYNAFASQDRPIKRYAQACEKEVVEVCTSENGTCHKFCEGINRNKKRNQKEAAIEKCKQECTPENRCKIKPLAGKDSPTNKELDAQNREQVIACIAEKRDPKGTVSGRRMIPWQDIKTPTYNKVISEPSK